MVKRSRADARIKEVTKEFDSFTRSSALSTLISTAPNEDLFVLDNNSSSSSSKSNKRARKSTASGNNISSTTKSRAKFLRDEPEEPHVVAGRKSVAGKIEGEEALSERFIHKVLVNNTEVMRKARVDQLSESRREQQQIMLGGVGIVKARDLWADESIAVPVRPKGASANPVPLKERVLGPGTSYNPEAEAHQEAIADAVAKALLRQRRRDDILSKISTSVAIEHDKYDPDDDAVRGDEWKKALLAAAPPPPIPAHHSKPILSIDNDSTVISGSKEGADIEKVKSKPLSRAAAKWEKLKSKHQEITSRGGKRAVEMAKFDADLNEAKELVLDDGRLASNLLIKPEAVKRRSAFNERKLASQALESTHEPVLVPLSDELGGSLRTIKPVTAAGLVLDRMAEMELNGRVHKRNRAHVAVQLDVTGDVQLEVQSKWQVNRVKGIGKPYKQIEFPRRRGFAPADIIQEDADRELAGLPPKKRH